MEPAGILVAVALIAAIYIAFVLVLLVGGRRLLARELVLLIPNLVGLFRGLLGDPGVPRRAKLVLLLATGYLLMPLDLVPDFIPVAGTLDDAIVAALALRYVLRVTDRATLAAHWRGDPATLERVLRIAFA
ncbi:MAG: DUF1232 domain-containing protein [Chloroflexi bacterium]|nr:DUF1232 domain-containing protein [Chloroflexota bacterium]